MASPIRRATKILPVWSRNSNAFALIAREAWREARQQSDFSLFKPPPQKLVTLTARMADHWGYQESPYDALMTNTTGRRASQVRLIC